MTRRDYFEASRQPRYSLVFAAPLLLLYEALAASVGSGSGVRNGADVLLKSLFVALGGHRGLLLFNLVLAAVAVGWIVRDWRRHPGRLVPGIFGGMLVESLALAVLVGVVVGRLTRMLLPQLSLSGGLASFDFPTQIMLSLGAGIYEELLFRVLLVGGLALAARRLWGWPAKRSNLTACVVGALIFAGFHYIGPYGDPFQLASFVFRTIAGMVFSALYLLRGFGITAWTHALYDVLITVAG